MPSTITEFQIQITESSSNRFRIKFKSSSNWVQILIESS